MLYKYTKFLTPQKIDNEIHLLAKTEQDIEIKPIGKSQEGRKIFMSKIGSGSFKILLVGFPHPNEPVGGTFGVYCVKNKALLNKLDCTIYFIHALEIDSAMRNINWIKKKFDFYEYINNSFIDAIDDQIEFCFPSNLSQKTYKYESSLLTKIFEEIRPNLYIPLHQSPTIGGAQFFLSKPDVTLIQNLTKIIFNHNIYLDKIPRGINMRSYAPGFFELYSYNHLPCSTNYSRETSFIYFRKLTNNHCAVFEIPFATTKFLADKKSNILYKDISNEYNEIIPDLNDLIYELQTTENYKDKNTRNSLIFWSKNWKFNPLFLIERRATNSDIAQILNLYFMAMILLGWWAKYVNNTPLHRKFKDRIDNLSINIDTLFKKYRKFIKIIPVYESVHIYFECFLTSLRYFYNLKR
jgi:hypothetical protein